MNKLYNYFLDCGRMGSVEGLFIATDEMINNALGKTVYFGEILGKHSEVSDTLKLEDLKVLSDDQDKINWLAEIVGLGSTISGYNPLDYIDDYDDELDYIDDYDDEEEMIDEYE